MNTPNSSIVRVYAHDHPTDARGLRPRRRSHAHRPLRRSARRCRPRRPGRAHDRGGRGAERARPGLDRRRLHGLHEPGRRGQPQRRADGGAGGLPVEVPGVTVSRLFASGLEAVNQRAVRCAWAGKVMLAAGWSRCRGRRWWGSSRSVRARRARARGHRRQFEPAERPSRWATPPRTWPSGSASRDQDAFALESHRRAVAAARQAASTRRSWLLTFPSRRPAGDRPCRRGPPRPDTSLERLAKLRPAFREGQDGA